MKKKFLLFLSFVLQFQLIFSQVTDTVEDATSELYNQEVLLQENEGYEKPSPYYRSSLYTLMLQNNKLYGDEIKMVFEKMELSEKFNNHDLSVKTLFRPSEEKIDKKELAQFLSEQEVARRLVAKWFDRDRNTGYFDNNLIELRSKNDISQYDIQVAKDEKGDYGEMSLLESVRNEAIKHTYVIINDISYIDKERKAKIVSTFAQMTSQVAGSVSQSTSGDAQQIAASAKSVADAVKVVSDAIAGMTVNITSYLFQLEWNNEYDAKMRNSFWCDGNTDAETAKTRKAEFDACQGLFKMKFVGEFSSKSSKTVFRDTYTQEYMIKKVCRRALDKNIVELQKKHEDFRLKTPIISVIDKKGYTVAVKDVVDGKVNFPENKIAMITAEIGMKEGVAKGSKFELVWQNGVDKKGNIVWEKSGIFVTPTGKIWNNLFSAIEDGEEDSELGFTTFKVVKGKMKEEHKNYLLRQVKY